MASEIEMFDYDRQEWASYTSIQPGHIYFLTHFPLNELPHRYVVGCFIDNRKTVIVRELLKLQTTMSVGHFTSETLRQEIVHELSWNEEPYYLEARSNSYLDPKILRIKHA